MGDFLGGGLVFAVAATLWIMYLIPTWKRRRNFDATEMNAVRMQQTIRALAETADVPEEVEVEASARAVIEQKRILREAEAAAMAEVREATAKAVGFDMKAYHAKRRARIARMISAVVLLITLVGTVVSGVMLFTAGAWQPLALWPWPLPPLYSFRKLSSVRLRPSVRHLFATRKTPSTSRPAVRSSSVPGHPARCLSHCISPKDRWLRLWWLRRLRPRRCASLRPTRRWLNA